ncbi:Retrovirus-related Pol polyprotein from transposon TNT 1-94 [Danaus plexippus plexippus]|uniref:Retrovirus-related Pol polyprotein from transposon TNT 1-94 n=1 Tax=Danaus plexippus plexippus TaxID=278856 RepID=A0A212EYJ5_DANPL|nr:Retrovirus-related Pol polyprotein from transposon TNT 1-94 [Danaus plexippus plexippus]
MSNDNGWYVDSGASMHLTMHRDWLYDEIPPLVDTIKVADDKKLTVKACGKVKLNVADQSGKSEVIEVNNVLYVPELATNLLSSSLGGAIVGGDQSALSGNSVVTTVRRKMGSIFWVSVLFLLASEPSPSVPCVASADSHTFFPQPLYFWAPPVGLSRKLECADTGHRGITYVVHCLVQPVSTLIDIACS